MRDKKEQSATLIEKAKRRGYSVMITYYLTQEPIKRTKKTKQGREVVERVVPKLTTCVLLDNELNPVSRGAAVLSRKDNPDKSFGRLLSLKRSYDAAMKINPPEVELIRLPEIPGFSRRYVEKKMKVIDIEELSSVERDRIQAKRSRLAERQLTA